MDLILTGASVIDGTGGPVLHDAAVTIQGDRIASVGAVTAPDASIVTDLPGHTIVPGLIDAHSHMGLVDLPAEGDRPLAVIAAQVFRNCELALDAGFTTVRDAGGVDGGVARAIEDGLVRGPRMLPSGPMLSPTGGHGDLRPPFADHRPTPGSPGLVEAFRVVDGPGEVRRAARETLRRGATQLKVCASGGIASPTDRLEDVLFSVKELRAAVEEAAVKDTYVTAHAYTAASIAHGLRAGISCFEHGAFLDRETAEAMKAAGAALVPTVSVYKLLADEGARWGLTPEMLDKARAVAAAQETAVLLAQEVGLTIGSGSDILGTEQGRRGYELVCKANLIGPMAAIVSATAVNAAILRRGHDIGTIAPRMGADLVVLDGDPLTEPAIFDDPDRVVMVVKGGVIVKDIRPAVAMDVGEPRR